MRDARRPLLLFLMPSFITAVCAVGVSLATGYALAVQRSYDHCLAEWKDAMTFGTEHCGVDDPQLRHELCDPPPDDWPGRNECRAQTERTFGPRWARVTPTTPPMPPYYDEHPDQAHL